MKTFITFDRILLIALIITVGLFWLERKDHDEEEREYWENPNFVTDSIKAYIDYDKLPKPEYRNYVPPAITIEYIDSTKSYQTTQVIKNDSLLLIIDSLRDEITSISINYLRNNPNSWKLIYGEFSSDSLKLDMVNLEGNTIRKTYGMNYDRFKYQFTYTDSFKPQLKATRISQQSKDEKLLSHSLYFTPGYEWLRKSPLLGLDYNLHFRKLRLGIDGNMTIEENPSLILKTDIGYKIW